MARYKRELILAGSLIGFGIFLLPFAVYVVGVEIVGPYEGEGAFGLLVSIIGALVRRDWAAWILVLSPYLIVQLSRLALRVLLDRPRVTPVTD